MEYLLKKICTAMNEEWDGKPLDALICLDPTGQDEGLSIWSFLEHMSEGHLLRVTNAEAFSLALDEVFLEMYHNVLKRVSSPSSHHPSLPQCSATLRPPLVCRVTCGKRGTCDATGLSAGSC